ncbi:MAG: alpha/beta hydrolase-fold protein [Bacteroidota bacterium]
MKSPLFLACLIAGTLLFSGCAPTENANDNEVKFSISFSTSLSSETKDGRLILMLSNDESTEPRFQIKDGPDTQLIFGADVEGMKSGESITMDASNFGYPITSLDDIPDGEYYVQALLHVYETFNLSTGHTVKLPMDNGEGQQWNRSPGNYYSQPTKIKVDKSQAQTFEIVMDLEIEPIEAPEDTKYIKHIRIKSEKLSAFWGRPMYLGAHVLLPEGFNEHPEARYPLMIFHGHYPHDFGGFREDPPDENLEPDYSERFNVKGYNITQQQEAHDFYKTWTGKDFPRVLIIKIQHQNPYYDDSYAVNSANLGPYGDAITYELIPHIEEEFRGIGQPWSRFLYGGSTGGWEALAAQVKYPDEYNGCFAACPDPIDFRAYCLVNLYEDKNAYYYEGDFKKVLRPGHRDYLGHVDASLRDMNYRELALGTKSRSGQQWDIWEAVYSPMGEDGYPKRIWDKLSGEIDPEVAQYWKENFDMRHIMERDWSKLGPKLEGKIHIYCGDMDNYYLNNAVYLMEEFLEATTNPYYGGEVDYGDRAEHCWNGDQENPNHISRLRYNTMYMDKILKRINASAPAGADLTSWRY